MSKLSSIRPVGPPTHPLEELRDATCVRIGNLREQAKLLDDLDALLQLDTLDEATQRAKTTQQCEEIQDKLHNLAIAHFLSRH